MRKKNRSVAPNWGRRSEVSGWTEVEAVGDSCGVWEIGDAGKRDLKGRSVREEDLSYSLVV